MELQFDSFVVGSIYVVTVVIEFIFYVPCMIVMKTDNHLKHHSCIRMMVQLGIADFFNMCSQLFAGITLMAGIGDKIPHGYKFVIYIDIIAYYGQYGLNKAWSSTHCAVSWYYYLFMCHIIAINRFVTICLPEHISEKLFSPKATTIWICVCVLFAGITWIFDMSPLGGWLFFPEVHSFYFDETAPMYELNKSISWWQAFINLNMSAIWYGCIVVYMCVKRQSMTNHQNAMQDRERRILIQASIICFYPLMFDQYYHLAPVLFEDYNFKYAYAVANWFWLSNSGINPLVYLTINKTILKKVKDMFRKPKTNSVQPTNQRVHPRSQPHGNQQQHRNLQSTSHM